MAVDATDKIMKNTAKQWSVEITGDTCSAFLTVILLENALLSTRKEANFITY